MDITTVLYLTIGGTMIFSLFMAVFVVSGKSIFFDFYRKLVPKGCDIEIVNSNRQVSHYYRVPKDGIFNIGKKIYITNPDKVMSLSEEMQIKVRESVKKKEEGLNKKIKYFEDKKESINSELDKMKDVPNSESKVNQLKGMIETLDQRIDVFKAKLEEREQIYYSKRRAKFYYIEGDPIPKDFHEWYTEMDSIAIDNVIARSMTKDPKAVKDMEKELKFMKFLVICTLGAAAASAVIAITIKTDITTIAQAVGVTLTL